MNELIDTGAKAAAAALRIAGEPPPFDQILVFGLSLSAGAGGHLKLVDESVTLAEHCHDRLARNAMALALGCEPEEIDRFLGIKPDDDYPTLAELREIEER